MDGRYFWSFLLYKMGLSYFWSFHGFKPSWAKPPPLYERLYDKRSDYFCCFLF